MKRLLTLAFVFTRLVALSQTGLKVQVREASTQLPIPFVTVAVDNRSIGLTDSAGYMFSNLPPGKYRLHFSSAGYKPAFAIVTLPDTSILQVVLSQTARELEAVTVISSTRNNQSIERSPLKVEVLGQEEMDEENTIKPGNIASILGDVSGIQIQQSSATSGNANVRIQGLEGRYTQILRDGMPLFEGFSGGFGILTIPPLDLRQIELIKGSASTLYGGGAIGGLINLISRRPSTTQEATMTVNASTLKEKNINIWASKKYTHTGYTLFAGYTRQAAVDVNDDGFSDVANINGFQFHPKIFFYPGSHSVVSIGYSGIFEKRDGGDMVVLANDGNSEHQYFEKNKITRHTGEIVYEQYLPHEKKFELKGSLSSFNRKIHSNIHSFNGRQTNYFSEASLLVPFGANNLVGGINLSGDRFEILPSDPVRLVPFSNGVVGAFGQVTIILKEATSLEAGLRYDYQNPYGGFLLPRIAVFHRINNHWGTRAGLGLGYKTPNPLVQQVVEIPIQDLPPVSTQLIAERSVGLNAEINYKTSWGKENSFFINHAFFMTTLRNPIVYKENAGIIESTNGPKPVSSRGFDTYIKLQLDAWELYAGYTYTVAERKYLVANQFMPLTPRNRTAFTLVKSWEEKWRIGLEGSYTGKQHRLDYTLTPGYLFVAAMIEHRFGKNISVVLNGENLLDYRQSKQEALYTGSMSDPQFNALWAPIDGRVINLSVRFKL